MLKPQLASSVTMQSKKNVKRLFTGNFAATETVKR